jgi:hypothetical protein
MGSAVGCYWCFLCFGFDFSNLGSSSILLHHPVARIISGSWGGSAPDRSIPCPGAFLVLGSPLLFEFQRRKSVRNWFTESFLFCCWVAFLGLLQLNGIIAANFVNFWLWATKREKLVMARSMAVALDMDSGSRLDPPQPSSPTLTSPNHRILFFLKPP